MSCLMIVRLQKSNKPPSLIIIVWWISAFNTQTNQLSLIKYYLYILKAVAKFDKFQAIKIEKPAKEKLPKLKKLNFSKLKHTSSKVWWISGCNTLKKQSRSDKFEFYKQTNQQSSLINLMFQKQTNQQPSQLNKMFQVLNKLSVKSDKIRI